MQNLLFRYSHDVDDEFQIAQKYFNVQKLRMKCPSDSTIVARYSCLPFYKDLEDDLASINSKLINSYAQHKWIANFEYYEQMKELTPETWELNDFHNCKDNGPFVVKGKTNSKKQSWDKMMFAITKKDVWDIVRVLNADIMIADQGIIIRKFKPLMVFEYGVGGMPFSNEWRFFFYKDQLLDYGFYWSGLCNFPEKAVMTQEGLDFAKKVATIAMSHCNFFVVDIAETATGNWILIEMNDGQMSGPSACDMDKLYSNLAKVLDGIPLEGN